MNTDNISAGHIAGKHMRQKDLKQEQAKLRKACADFEAVLLNQMFESMRKSLSGNDIFGGSLARDIYDSMYYQQLSTDMAHSRNHAGLGAAMYAQMKDKL